MESQSGQAATPKVAQLGKGIVSHPPLISTHSLAHTESALCPRHCPRCYLSTYFHVTSSRFHHNSIRWALIMALLPRLRDVEYHGQGTRAEKWIQSNFRAFLHIEHVKAAQCLWGEEDQTEKCSRGKAQMALWLRVQDREKPKFL